MLEVIYKILETVLPFDWMRYDFMKNAFLGILLVSPLFALLGTMVISNRMAFFSDVLGHSALTGVAIGVILGLNDPTLSMIFFAIIVAIAVNFIKDATHSHSDTVLGVFMAVIVALGIVILSRQGGFSKYTEYLIGDILALKPGQLAGLIFVFIGVAVYWVILGNALVVACVDRLLARSRGVSVFLVEVSFSVILAIVVSFSIKLAGILIINSLLILPAAAARNISSNMKQYTFIALLISIFSGISGLILSYYLGTASGATIVLVIAFVYLISVAHKIIRKKATGR